MKKLATKLTPAIKAWIKEEFGSDRYDGLGDGLFHWSESKNIETGHNLRAFLQADYTEVSEQEFLAEFGEPKPIIQTRIKGGEWVDVIHQDCYRIKPTPDYSKEIEALQEKAKKNGMNVIIKFEKL